MSNYEAVAANAVRRSLAAGEDIAVPRVSDLTAMAATTSGKIEVEAFEDGSEGRIIDALVRSSVHTVFVDSIDPALHGPIVDAFEEGVSVEVGPGVAPSAYVKLLDEVKPLRPAVDALLDGDDMDASEPAVVASAVELILEGLHLGRRLNKNELGGSAQYRGRT